MSDVQTAAQAAQQRTALGNAAVKHKHFLWGGLSIAAGLAVGYFWLWGNMIQIQTSEAWIIGTTQGLSLAPNFHLYLQLTELGREPFKQSIAIVWGWTNQIILLAFSIGMEMHLVVGKIRQNVWQWGCIFFIVLNSLADLSYGGYFGGSWQPWAFAGITFMSSFFFGLAAFGLLIKGFKQIF